MLKNTTTPHFKHQNNEIVEFQVSVCTKALNMCFLFSCSSCFPPKLTKEKKLGSFAESNSGVSKQEFSDEISTLYNYYKQLQNSSKSSASQLFCEWLKQLQKKLLSHICTLRKLKVLNFNISKLFYLGCLDTNSSLTIC